MSGTVQGRRGRTGRRLDVKGPTRGKKIWVDLDNSPHVPFFIPIMKELEQRGHEVVLTTRDCFQVCGLADYYQLKYDRIGRHYGANKVLKVLGTLWRTLQLAPRIVREKPDVSLSHGSRSLVLLSSLLGIPTVLLFDYEFSKSLPFLKPALGVAPEVITDPALGKHFKAGIRHYPGLKEDVYVASFTPDSGVLRQLNLSGAEIIATIRPPATEAHYHNAASEALFVEVVEFLAATPGVRMVILPRNERVQRDFIANRWPELIKAGTIILPTQVINGLDLIWHSDFVVSGGGTMNREAAALGVPVYSIFRGRIGAVDRYLADHGRLTLVETVDDVRSKIKPVRREKGAPEAVNRAALQRILAATEEVLASVE
jgi:predicted glycosyltransferase